MRKFSFLFSILIITITVQSCQKDAADPLPPDPPVDSTLLVSSISWASPLFPIDDVTVSFEYSKSANTIQVYADDPSTSTAFDYLGLKYYYTSDGYFLKRETYDESRNVVETFSAERDNNKTLKRVLFERVGPDAKKDTFNFSFADSIGNPSYKIMTVSNFDSNLGAGINIVKKYSFLGRNVVKEVAGDYSDGQGYYHHQANYDYAYDGNGRLISVQNSDYYGMSLTYESTGTGLDSMFAILGGVDGHYITNVSDWLFDSDIEFYFFPLYLILGNNSAELGVETHRFGAIKEVKALPNGPSFPDNDLYSFANKFDAKQRLVESKVSNNGSLYGTWTFKYQ